MEGLIASTKDSVGQGLAVPGVRRWASPMDVPEDAHGGFTVDHFGSMSATQGFVGDYAGGDGSGGPFADAEPLPPAVDMEGAPAHHLFAAAGHPVALSLPLDVASAGAMFPAAIPVSVMGPTIGSVAGAGGSMGDGFFVHAVPEPPAAGPSGFGYAGGYTFGAYGGWMAGAPVGPLRGYTALAGHGEAVGSYAAATGILMTARGGIDAAAPVDSGAGIALAPNPGPRLDVASVGGVAISAAPPGMPPFGAPASGFGAGVHVPSAAPAPAHAGATGQSTDASFSRAFELYNAGDYAGVMAVCSSLYDKPRRDIHLLLLMGAATFQMRDLDASIRFSEEALSLEPNFAEALGNIGNVYKERGDFERAISFYNRAATLKPTFADVFGNLGSVLLRLNRNEEALANYQRAVLLRPDQAYWLCDLGHLYRMFGQLDQAANCFMQSIRLKPGFATAWSNMACIHKDRNNVDEAVRYYRKAIEIDPAFVAGYTNLGNVLKDTGHLSAAAEVYHQAIRVGGDNAIVYGNLAATELEMGHIEQSIATFNKALDLMPEFADALSNRGNAYKLLGRVSDSMDSYQLALHYNPDHPDALNNLANTYRDLQRSAEAEEMYRRAIRARPTFAGAHSNLGNLLKEQHKLSEALLEYQTAINCDPCFADAYSNMGNALKDLGRFDEAIASYCKAIELRPTFADAFANLASVYKDAGRLDEAIANYRQALRMKDSQGLPPDPIAWCNLLHCLQTVCDWRDRATVFSKTWTMIHEQMDAGQVPAVQPHHALVYPFSAEKQLEIATHYAAAAVRNVRSLGLEPFVFDLKQLLARFDSGVSRRLRLGYVSSDFGNHPLGHLMQHVFVWHDTADFEVFCYATSPNDGSKWRVGVESGVEHFKDVAGFSHGDLAHMIYEDQVDILVNLNGYTKGSRNDVFALHPAPIQIMYMGFPGSSGSDYHEYYVTDRVTSPPDTAHLFTERLAYMPDCYFVNDHAQSYVDCVDHLKPLSDEQINSMRAALGLPPRPAVVFCMFNQLYKIDPDVFSCWMDILKAVPGSVLWLLTFPASGKPNIIAAAVERGVAKERLIFTPVAPKEQHIARGRCADLFLDTTLCNAHTTATDILWAGTPLITCPQRTMASRVASSIVSSLGCPELICSDLAEYYEKAVHYGSNMKDLRDLQHKVQKQRLASPLFNTRQWVRDFGRLLFALVDDFMETKTRESEGDQCERPCFVEIEPLPFGDGIVELPEPVHTVHSALSSGVLPVATALGPSPPAMLGAPPGNPPMMYPQYFTSGAAAAHGGVVAYAAPVGYSPAVAAHAHSGGALHSFDLRGGIPPARF